MTGYARFQVLRVAIMKVKVYWGVVRRAASDVPKDHTGFMNVENYSPNNTALHPRRNESSG